LGLGFRLKEVAPEAVTDRPTAEFSRRRDVIRRVHEKTGDSLAYFLRRKTPGEQQQGDKERSVAVPVYEVKGKTARRFCVQFVGQSPLCLVPDALGRQRLPAQTRPPYGARKAVAAPVYSKSRWQQTRERR
jgi:hypothetical protein